MSRAALKRVEYALNQNFTPDSESWLEVGDTADERLYLRDLRAVIALAKRTEELERRLNHAHRVCAENGLVCLACADVAQGLEEKLPRAKSRSVAWAKSDYERLLTPAERRRAKSRGRR